MCGCSNFNGNEPNGGVDRHANEFINNEDISFDNFGEDFEEDDYTESDDGEFDTFLTKRSRARRKLRKKLKKSGMSRKDRRKKALASIPKQKIGKLLSNALRGKTDPETNKLIKSLKKKGALSKSDGIDKIAEKIEAATNENVSEGTQNMGTEGDAANTSTTPTTQAGGGKKKIMIMVGVGAVVLIGGYFAFFRK